MELDDNSVNKRLTQSILPGPNPPPILLITFARILEIILCPS